MTAHLLECIDCGKHHLPAEVEYLCPSCSARQKPLHPLLGLLRCVYEYEATARYFERDALESNSERGLGRWLPILPISSAASLPPLIESATPLRPAERLRQELGLAALWLKDDTVMPTASFKDRASALVVAVARERGHDVVATASTGNAATALAGQAAAVGISSVIFAPEKAPAAKLAQIAVFGGRLIPVKGTYDEAFELSIEACRHFGWYNRNTAYNPYTVEGKKTAALEIWEGLDYEAPDWIIIPTGDGVIAAGIEQGFRELAAMKLVDRVPRLALVQADGCMPIVRAFESEDLEIKPALKPHTIADSISVGVPRAGRWAMKALVETKGVAVA
ncbi:MAG: pyridoxal-phosphate dependent enzyme, partial [bacterium]